MNNRLETLTYNFTVEGETEQWYLYWLRDEVNKCEGRLYDVSFDVKVQQSPKKYYKSINVKAKPIISHICDVESNESVHVLKFQNILSEMSEAEKQKKITYTLGYSNFTFELWMVLHKLNCNGPLNNRNQYLKFINKAFGENFENLDQYKHEDNFKRCLKKLSLADVREAIRRADIIEKNNKENGNVRIFYKKYSYFRDNPALSVHSIIEKILEEVGAVV